MPHVSLRERLLDALPRPLALPLYRLRNREQVLRAEVLDGLWLELGFPARSTLWNTRLRQRAGHEAALCAWLRKYLRPDEVFVDVGAAFGFFPALVQALQPTAEIHALEAGWKQLLYLDANNRRHGGRWQVREGLLGDHDDARTLRLDTYAATLQRPPTLVKMDVDGAEFAILSGARQLIAAGRTEWLIEIHPHALPDFGATAQQVLALFPAAQYRIRILPNLRYADGAIPDPDAGWFDDLTWLDRDPNPYLYIAPRGRGRA